MAITMITPQQDREIFNRIQTLRFNTMLDYFQIAESIQNSYPFLTREECLKLVEQAVDMEEI